MPYPMLDRSKLVFHPLSERRDRVFIAEDHVAPSERPRDVSAVQQRTIDETVRRIRAARENDRPRMLVFGAHAIKNGLAPVFTRLIENGWVTHLATNGAGIIHDWEFAFQGHSSEHVAENVAEGRFGMWRETGLYLNLALAVGAYRGFGYGESVGALAQEEALDIPSEADLAAYIVDHAAHAPGKAAAAADLLSVVREMALAPGRMEIPHPFKEYGLQAAAYRLGVPFTGHPMIGHDIIYNHPCNHCAAVGRTAQRDFLTFAHSVSRLEGGVYMSIGSAVMSPMIFEKSLSMGQNLALQRGERIASHHMTIVDLQESHWDWTRGEPPEDNPDYYLRYNKSFSRMGGVLRYVSMDNRDFLLALLHTLETPA